MRKQISMLEVEPRCRRGYPIVLMFLIIIMCIFSWTVNNCFESILSDIFKWFISINISVYLVNLVKTSYSLKYFNKFYSRINPKVKTYISVAVGGVFVYQVVNLRKQEVDKLQMVKIFVCIFLSSFIIWVLDLLKFNRNQVEDEIVIEKMGNNMNVGKGLAMAYFRFIENVIKGEVMDGKIISPSHKQALDQYIAKEFGDGMKDQRDWFGDKILIFFPESDTIRGSVRDIIQREKDDGESHGLVMERISHPYEKSGQPRTSVIHVLKVKDKTKKIVHKCNGSCPLTFRRGRSFAPDVSAETSENTPPCSDYHERVEWQNNYVIFVENRPLNTLYQMINEPTIQFTRRDFETQFRLYYLELQRLVRSDKDCKGQCELFLYQDYRRQKMNFSQNLIKKINSMKN